jgi:hypothetical protein
MSLLKAIKTQLGLSGTPANNFTLDASANNGTMKLARGNAGATTQDIITVDAAGKMAFPAQGQNLISNGYVKLPGGIIIQWGFVTTPSGGPTTVTFPTAFSAGAFNIQATVVSDGGSANAGLAFVASVPTATSFPVGALTADTGAWAARTVYWQAIGT